MKRLLSIVLCGLFLLSLASCGAAPKDFVMPAKTDELVIYAGVVWGAQVSSAVRLFEELYTDVNPVVEEFNMPYFEDYADKSQRKDAFRHRVWRLNFSPEPVRTPQSIHTKTPPFSGGAFV